MTLRYIDNVTILADIGENITLPSVLIAREDNGDLTPVNVSWTPSTVDTSQEYELIFEGYVAGYAHTVLCSVQVGKMEDNPRSVFPDGVEGDPPCEGGICIDDFGLPKKDIQTADIPDIDDYQYFKAKVPRTMVEELQLKQLRELLADKIILARDINHMRNAIIAIEEFLRNLSNRLDDLEKRVEILEALIQDMVTDGRNIGSGSGVFSSKVGSVLEFKSLVGSGIDISDNGSEIVLTAEIPDMPDAETGCGSTVEGGKFKVCGDGVRFQTEVADGSLRFSEYFGMRMVKVVNRKTSGGDPYDSMLWLMGSGADTNMLFAGRMLKAGSSFIMEMKINVSEYAGVVINADGGSFYKGASKINEELVGMDAYSLTDSKIP